MEKLFSVQYPRPDGVFDAIKLFEECFIVLLVDIEHHITDLLIGFEILPQDIDIHIRKDSVDFGKYTRFVFMDVKDPVGVLLLRQVQLRYRMRSNGCTIVDKVDDLGGYIEANIELGFEGGSANMRRQDYVGQILQL